MVILMSDQKKKENNMTIQDEQKMLETIYKNILSVKQETEKYLAKWRMIHYVRS